MEISGAKRHNWKCEMGQKPGPGEFQTARSKTLSADKSRWEPIDILAMLNVDW